jgi:2'-5' RNA ligase
VTLIFLGRHPAERAEEIWRLAGGAVAGLTAPTLQPLELVPLPRRRPRLLALDLADDGGRAGAVQGALEAALTEARLYEPEKRPFWPHVTLARVRGRSRPSEVEAEPPPGAAFRAPGLTLYRSDLHPSGARYVPLERLELGR